MLNVEWQTRRWREAGDTAKLHLFHEHIKAGLAPRDALVAAAVGVDPQARPEPPILAPVRVPPQGGLAVWAWTVAAMVALVGAVWLMPT